VLVLFAHVLIAPCLSRQAGCSSLPVPVSLSLSPRPHSPSLSLSLPLSPLVCAAPPPEPEEPKFQAFVGSGRRLDGKPASPSQAGAPSESNGSTGASAKAAPASTSQQAGERAAGAPAAAAGSGGAPAAAAPRTGRLVFGSGAPGGGAAGGGAAGGGVAKEGTLREQSVFRQFESLHEGANKSLLCVQHTFCKKGHMTLLTLYKVNACREGYKFKFCI